jgi:hypothetical protein
MLQSKTKIRKTKYYVFYSRTGRAKNGVFIGTMGKMHCTDQLAGIKKTCTIGNGIRKGKLYPACLN